jgi:hypothetical protein
VVLISNGKPRWYLQQPRHPNIGSTVINYFINGENNSS